MYAFILCWVAIEVLESDAILSSSKMDTCSGAPVPAVVRPITLDVAIFSILLSVTAELIILFVVTASF